MNGNGTDSQLDAAVNAYIGLHDQQRREFIIRTANTKSTIEPTPDPNSGMTPPGARAWSVKDLLDTEFSEARCAIPGILPVGLDILGGRPKVGKSWLALQAAYSIGTGGKFLNIDVEQGKVLYLALEDTPRRLKRRILDMGVSENADIEFRTEWRTLHEGGLDDLMVQISSDSYRLVIIDTLSKSIPGIDQNDPTVIGPLMSSLQSLGQHNNLAILVIDHIRKPMGIVSDPIDDIISSTAKTAISDTILALYKEQGKPGAILTGRGRDIEEINLKLTFDRELSCWQSEGDASQLSMTERRQEIVNALEILGPSQLEGICRTIGQPKSNTYNRLQDLFNSGLVKRYKIGEKVYYELNK